MTLLPSLRSFQSITADPHECSAPTHTTIPHTTSKHMRLCTPYMVHARKQHDHAALVLMVLGPGLNHHRQDGLQQLQDAELDRQREVLTARWEKERARRRKVAQRAYERSKMLQGDEADELVDWERVGRPAWDVDDKVGGFILSS